MNYREVIEKQIKTELEYSPNDKGTQEYITALRQLLEENDRLKSQVEDMFTMGVKTEGIISCLKAENESLHKQLKEYVEFTVKSGEEKARLKSLISELVGTLKEVRAEMGNKYYNFYPKLKQALQRAKRG